ncbi:serine/threonine-protein kinase [Trebonia sp.]|uniref:serine/threonine-protein kinase n=1 Tax=Trebonia sp. TaxID=2767075 RepID=UPI002636B602|nr:serine/threonine-protein kinase [Trebonia sp.]
MTDWAVPGYTALKPLGSGGFGTVMLARHDATGTPVAIKYLHPQMLADPHTAQLFRAEAIVLSSLDDPYVVRLYEYVESPAGAAIVMELIDGTSLREILTRQGRTTPEAALVVLLGSLLGLAAAHARGVVHRDYKPENVLVNGYGASKLTDFGIAARAGTPGTAAGTLAYAPPEQFDGAPATPASDVYAATATFYECLAGHPPFTGQTLQTLMYQHRTEPVPMEPVPEPLRSLVARGMAKNPAYRPADAGALATDLRTAAAGAYGRDWQLHGRTNLGEAALLLAALWPSGGAGIPALHGFTAEQVRLQGQNAPQTGGDRPQQAREARNSQRGGQGRETRAEQHQWHLRHILHLEHLAHLRYLRSLGTVLTVAAAAAVVAAGVTFAVTGHSPSPPGPAGSAGQSASHSAVSVHPVSLQPSVAPGDYPVNRVITDDSPWTLTLASIDVLASGEAEFIVEYTNTGSTAGQLTCSGVTGADLETVTFGNGQTISSIATFCSQHPNAINYDVGAGQSSMSYAIFPDAGKLTQPFTLSWGSGGDLAGELSGLKLP